MAAVEREGWKAPAEPGSTPVPAARDHDDPQMQLRTIESL